MVLPTKQMKATSVLHSSSVMCCILQCCLFKFSSTRGNYGQGDKKEKFRFARTLVLIQCIISALFAKICEYALYRRGRNKTKMFNIKKWKKYIYVKLSLLHFWCLLIKTSSFLVIQFFESSKQDHTKSWLYGLCSLSYLGAMVSSNSALQYVNYPTQVSLPFLYGEGEKLVG